MFYVYFLLQILALFTVTEETFQLIAPKDLACQASGIQCMTNITYTTCHNILSFTILYGNSLKCPDGYVCRDTTNGPCVLPGSPEENVTTTENSTVTTTPVPTTTLLSTTTKKIVPRPTGEPKCSTTGLYGAPKCTQYYECVKNQFFFITTFQAVLKTCPNSEYFDITTSKCTTPELSDCVE